MLKEEIDFDFNIKLKKPRRIPVVLSVQEVERFLNCFTNLKHKAIFKLIYSAGLRVGELLREYVKSYQPKVYLFEGQNGGKYSSSPIQALIRKHKKLCKINKKATPHTLRHCFATHLLDTGTDTRLIQELLGHKNTSLQRKFIHMFHPGH